MTERHQEPDPTLIHTPRRNEPDRSTARQPPTEDVYNSHSTPVSPLEELDGRFQQPLVSQYGSENVVGTRGSPVWERLTVKETAQNDQIPFPSTLLSRSANSLDLQREGLASDYTPELEDGVDRPSPEYEMELLSRYRYHIATILDLGIGSLYFGIQVLLRSPMCKHVYYAILAVASCHRSRTNDDPRPEDDASSLAYATQAENGLSTAIPEDHAIIRTLLLWRHMLLAPPTSWHQRISHLPRQPGNLTDSLPGGLREMTARLSLAAALLADRDSWDFSYEGRSSFTPGHTGSAQGQLQQSFSLLEQAVIATHDVGRSSILESSSRTSAWRGCWRDIQKWHVARTEEMQQIFELKDTDAAEQPATDAFEFPIIVFSNAAAAVANIVHHTTALLLLQQKPRLTRAAAEEQSSISPMWHALRVVGIAATASNEAIWDPVVAFGVLFAGRKFSHEKQLSLVTDVLVKGAQRTGMTFKEEIEKLRQIHDMSTN